VAAMLVEPPPLVKPFPGSSAEADRRRADPRSGDGDDRALPAWWFGATVRGITTWRLCAVAVWLTFGEAEAGEITVPAGFQVSVFAENLGGVRGLAVDPDGVVVASIPSRGRVVALPDPAGSGRAVDPVTLVKDLDRPHGLAFRRGDLYVAETGRVVRYRYRGAALTAVEPTVVVRALPPGAHHWTRSIAFGPDDKLYVAVGSSCDVCREADPRRAAIVRYEADGSGEQVFATGLRNPVGLTFHPTTGALWTTVNERDWPGGGAPGDYVTEVRRGAAYGWPRCFARSRVFVRDPTFADAGGCPALTLPTLELSPHAAPLGLVFYTGRQFPSEYVGNLFVALHGSRAGLPAAGYAIVRVRFGDGNAVSIGEFAGGWRRGDRVTGRPVDLALGRDGSLYVSDDHADRVYRVSYPAR
jgi:glucose/arabinose dehydrogenase